MKKFLGQVSSEIYYGKDKRTTKYVSEKLVIKATRRGKYRKNGNVEIVLTIGRPNYIERKFIKCCKKAGEKFPIKKIQLKPYPKKGK